MLLVFERRAGKQEVSDQTSHFLFVCLLIDSLDRQTCNCAKQHKHTH